MVWARDSASPEADSDAEDLVDHGERSHLNPNGTPRMISRDLVVPPELAGLRLDHFLKTQIPRLSRTKLQAIIDTTLRRADGRACKASALVAAGEVFTIVRPARPEPPCPRTFGVLHDDADLLVIDKPAGLPMHASAKFYFNTVTRVLAERYPGQALQICHRLDRETSGALVVAKHREAAAVVKQAFATKRVRKTYLAVVHGTPPWPRADLDPGAAPLVIDAPMRVATAKDPSLLPGVRMLVADDGAPSRTGVRVLRTNDAHSLIECSPLTGRQHQIRVHLAHLGYPIVGDKLYAHGEEAFMRYCDSGLDDELAAMFVLPRHALHAAAVALTHPGTGGELCVNAPLPADLAGLVHSAS